MPSAELKNDRLIRALLREPVDRTPVWMMRQAGRYLPEYRAVREKAGNFLKMCKTPELACEVTLQPLRRFPLDAAILFSDILTIPDAMGLGLYFVEGEGPKFNNPLRTAAQIEQLGKPDPSQDLRYVMDAMRLVRRELNGSAPLIGFSGSPWTLATYMVEGGGGHDFGLIKRMLYDEPKTLELLLSKLTLAVRDYLNAQIEAGAQAVMIFDTWGGSLSAAAYREFSLAYLERIVADLKREHDGQRIPNSVFTKGGGPWLEAIAAIGCDAVGLDWTVDLGEARRRVGAKVALQGNIDPTVLFASPERIRHHTQLALEAYGRGTGHVFNLGHGVSQYTPPEHVGALVEAVHELSRRFH